MRQEIFFSGFDPILGQIIPLGHPSSLSDIGFRAGYIQILTTYFPRCMGKSGAVRSLA